jgi:hypothetical protein
MDEVDPILARFADAHAIDVRDLPEAESDAVRWVLKCADAVDHAYAALPEHVLEVDVSAGVLWHLLARSDEMTMGAIVALAAKSGSAAEVLSRAAIERAIAVRFILLDPGRHLAAYFRHHVDDVDAQISKWRSASESLNVSNRRLQVEACDQRAEANRHMRTFVERLETDLVGASQPVKWPSRIIERFERLDDGVTYRTMYARLCSETHFDAEETLRYILGKVSDDSLMERMALETIGFTRLAVAMAVVYHLRAMCAYTTRYEMQEAAELCRLGVERLDRWVEDLSKHVGGISTTG